MTYDKTTALRLIADRPTDHDRAHWDLDHYADEACLYLGLLASQLEAAVAEVDRLTSELDHIAPADERDHLSRASRRMVEMVMGDRDTLREKLRILRAEFETDDPAQIIATMHMVIADRDRMQDALAAADPQAEAALAIDVLLEVNEGRPDTRVVQLAQQVLRLTARAQVAELEIAAMRPVVEAAAKVTMGRWVAVGMLVEAADAYTAGAEARDAAIARIAGNAPAATKTGDTQ